VPFDSPTPDPSMVPHPLGSPIDESQRLGPHNSAPDPDHENHEGAPLVLTPFDARLLGAMAEKALATPQNYPLSINALATACNQTTNRDPITHYSEAAISDELPRLKERKLLRFVHPTTGRGVTKYRQVLNEYLGIDNAEIALLSVLLVRGPQTVAELRARTERLHGFASTTEIEDCLREMSSADGAKLALRLEREPGHREPRWIQTLCPEQGEQRAGTEPAASSATYTASRPEPAPYRPGLEDEVARLSAELSQLRVQFDAFRAEFG